MLYVSPGKKCYILENNGRLISRSILKTYDQVYVFFQEYAMQRRIIFIDRRGQVAGLQAMGISIYISYKTN